MSTPFVNRLISLSCIQTGREFQTLSGICISDQFFSGFKIGGKLPWTHFPQLGTLPAAVTAQRENCPAQVI